MGGPCGMAISSLDGAGTPPSPEEEAERQIFWFNPLSTKKASSQPPPVQLSLSNKPGKTIQEASQKNSKKRCRQFRHRIPS